MSQHPLSVLVLMDQSHPGAREMTKQIALDRELQSKVKFQFKALKDLPERMDEAFHVLVTADWRLSLSIPMESVRWVHSLSAGMEHLATEDLKRRNILISGSSGVHGPNIAEHVLAMMLMFTRRMPFYHREQLKGHWVKSDQYVFDSLNELQGQTLGLMGFGKIAQEIAKRAKAFGMKVVAFTVHPDSKRASQIDRLYQTSEWKEVFHQADHFCLAVPATRETAHFIDAEKIREFKKGVYFYNIGRGSAVDEIALVDALKSGQIAYAGLDVFEKEPLPETHPFWKMENVLMTPHISGGTPKYFERAVPIFLNNLKNFISEKPLENQFDWSRGY